MNHQVTKKVTATGKRTTLQDKQLNKMSEIMSEQEPQHKEMEDSAQLNYHPVINFFDTQLWRT